MNSDDTNKQKAPMIEARRRFLQFAGISGGAVAAAAV